jgi:CubicO group peptidase (beta-lactamase class C family)
MSRAFALRLLVLALAFPLAGQETGSRGITTRLSSPGSSVNLDSLVQREMAEHHIPGLSACGTKDGRVVWSGSYGWASIEDSIPATDSTLYTLASVSKTATGTALMQLWERGLFGLDDDISPFLPFPVRSSYYPDSATTFRMLLTHTSGIRDNWAVLDPLMSDYDPAVSLRELCEGYFVPGGQYYDSAWNFYDWAPGHDFSYSNTAVSLAGFLVECIADSFPRYCRDSVFLPLGMTATSYLFADLDTDDVAMQYTWDGQQVLPWGRRSWAIFPACNLKSSVGQLARFLIAYQQSGRYDTTRILDSATVALMTTHPQASGFGLIWFHEYLGRWEMWGHTGGWWGTSTYLGFCRAMHTGTVVLCNMDGGVAIPAIHDIATAILDFAATAVEETPNAEVRTANVWPTIARGVLLLPKRTSSSPSTNWLLDIAGRKVLDLHPGANDVRTLAPGVYFVREVQAQAVRKVVVTR